MKPVVLIVAWEYFNRRRTEELRGDRNVLQLNPVSISLPPGSSHWDAVQDIAKRASRPFPVKFVSELMKGSQLIRGRSYFGNAADQIDKILANYPTLRWWMESDGLVIDKPAIDLSHLDPFDKFAGKLAHSRWIAKRLPKEVLVQIAAQLDTEGFALKNCLQPAQWRPIALHNQKYAGKAVRTFEAAAKDSRFIGSVRKRLGLARDRYRKALKSNDVDEHNRP